MKKQRIKISEKIGKLSLILIALLMIVLVPTTISGKGSQKNPVALRGPGKTANVSCKSRCTSISANGAFWFVITEENGLTDDIDPISDLGFIFNLTKEHIVGCLSTGGAAYILATKTYQKDTRETIGLSGPADLDVALTSPYGADAPWDGPIPMGGTRVSNAEAAAEYERLKVQQVTGLPYTGSSLGWFCGGEYGTVTPPPEEITLNCQQLGFLPGDKSRGRTWSRVAVENMSLDLTTFNPLKNLNSLWKYRSGSARESQLSGPDSGWTISVGDAETVAKPGDSIRFLHAICMANRAARKTTTQDAWTDGEEDHDQIYPDMDDSRPGQKFEIFASPSEKYLFEDKIEPVNKQSKDGITAFNNLFSGSGAGIAVDAKGFGVGVLSPSTGNEDYDCSEHEQYDIYDPFHAGGFQIPGFTSGSCKASQKVGENNHVGKTIIQYHEFDSIDVWEQYSSTKTGDCGCDEGRDFSDVYIVGHYGPQYPYGEKQGGDLGDRKSWGCKEPGDGCGTCYEWTIDLLTGRETQPCLNWSNTIYGHEDSDYSMYYKTAHKYQGHNRKTATVYIPYNFETATAAYLEENDDVLYQGMYVTPTFTWNVTPRGNEVTSDMPYATVTGRDAKVLGCEFILPPNADSEMSGTRMYAGGNPCGYYGGVWINSTQLKSGELNPTGDYFGSQGAHTKDRLIPDDNEYVGYKYCVATAMYPSDSHDYQGNEGFRQKEKGFGRALDPGTYWNVSDPSCRTIAKKPNFQVWNGSVYTEGSIATSVSKKVVGGGINTPANAGKTIFGSWSDYMIVAAGSVRGMSSGAKIGYNNNTFSFGRPAGQPQTSLKEISKLTISNNGGTMGESGINASASILQNEERLFSRYRDKVETLAKENNTMSDGKHIYTTNTGFQYLLNGGGIDTRSISSQINQLPGAKNNTTTVVGGANGGIYKRLGDGKNDNTLVIYVKGKLVINSNICLSTSIENCRSDSTKLINYSDIGTDTAAISRLPQILIFADDIDITENVTRVDAWLISKNAINTCSNSLGGSDETSDAGGRYTGSNARCYKTLVVNGPVYAKNIKLNRNAGNYHGQGESNGTLNTSLGGVGNNSDSKKGSVAPAEIFNMRADIYLWAYDQTQRSTEAVITYMRELAPRY